MMPPPPSRLPNNIPADQSMLLTIIQSPTLTSFRAPQWHHIQDRCDELDLGDATDIMKALPQVGLVGQLVGPCYGFTVPPRYPIGDEEQIRLTVAASLVLPNYREQVGEPFVRALQLMIKIYNERPKSPHEKTYGVLTSEILRQELPDVPEAFIAAFPHLLDTEPYIGHAGGSYGDETWTKNVDRDVLQYRDVATVQDYVAKTCDLILKSAGAWPVPPALPLPTPHPRTFVVGESVDQVVGKPEADNSSAPGSYIAEDQIAELAEAGAATTWELDKLLGLLRELNQNVAAGNPYSCQALIRAILDHIPPVFGQPSFDGVISSYKWTKGGARTDKKYAERLNEHRITADDVLHRHMRDSRSWIDMDDLPARSYLSAVLNEVLLLLRKDADSA
jgi:hypothetical protein